jgi:hypothetical protein
MRAESTSCASCPTRKSPSQQAISALSVPTRVRSMFLPITPRGQSTKPTNASAGGGSTMARAAVSRATAISTRASLGFGIVIPVPPKASTSTMPVAFGSAEAEWCPPILARMVCSTGPAPGWTLTVSQNTISPTLAASMFPSRTTAAASTASNIYPPPTPSIWRAPQPTPITLPRFSATIISSKTLRPPT